ncbi:MAG: hypothetical protein AKCLJLPJ_01503 [Fimbriimonadales bacterium]|nr:hypothetical protein [Fimbriimonadales bacterium]
MGQVVRYKPADIGRWLEMGTASVRTHRQATEKPAKIPARILEALGTVMSEGKSAVAAVASRQLEKFEVLLGDKSLESGGRTLAYSEIKAVTAGRGLLYRFETDDRPFIVKPYAWLEMAGHRVPLGWLRNGIEVPYETLAEEIAARSRVPFSDRG